MSLVRGFLFQRINEQCLSYEILRISYRYFGSFVVRK